MKILFIQTGGTIDKDYPRKTGGYAFEISGPAVAPMLEKLNPSFYYVVLPLLKKDSQYLVLKDREMIAHACKRDEADKIVITHGTDTMIETAKHLEEKVPGKLIILTGAMKPARFKDTDAEINLGVALGACAVLEKGVFVAMQGIVKKPGEISRDKKTGQFY